MKFSDGHEIPKQDQRRGVWQIYRRERCGSNLLHKRNTNRTNPDTNSHESHIEEEERRTFLILSAFWEARVAEGSRVNRMPRLRLADDTQKRSEIRRLAKNIRPRVSAVQDVVESPIDDRACDSAHEN